MAGRFVPLGARDVGGIIQAYGAFLRSARAPEFAEDAGQQRALDAFTRARLIRLCQIVDFPWEITSDQF
jgi:hypothetical protein